MPKETTVTVHNGINYDDGFIIKKLAEKFVGQFNSLGKTTEKIIVS